MSQNRSEWNSSFAFLIAMIGSAVGLGNIWRFPYVLYSNGGGSFIIPYIVAILLLGFSLALLEYSVGYKFKASFSKTFNKIKPKLEYVAWFICFTVFLIVSYYVTVIGWDLLYLILSFFKGWGADPNLFFIDSILNQNNSIAGLFTFSPLVLIATILVWAMAWYISHRNINSGIAKVSKILVPLLFVMVIIIVLFSLTLPGASIGYSAMFTPDWGALLDLNIWIAAFGQILFSLSLGMAILITYSSYLPDDSKLVDNAAIVIFSNSSFEIFNAIGVFSILGFMSFTSGIQINELITEGTGLAFIAFPKVFNVMGDAAYILGPLFFACILFAGITSLVSLLEPFIDSISDKFGSSRKKTTTIICIIGFCISTIFTTGMGSFILEIFDGFLNNFSLLLGVLFECVIFGWFYSIDDLLEVINKNTSIKIGIWWKNVVKYVLPIVLSVLLLKGIYDSIFLGSPEEYVIKGILILLLIIVPIVLTKVKGKENSVLT